MLFTGAWQQLDNCISPTTADKHGCCLCLALSCSHWLPCCTGHPSQVTSLELSGHVTDHALGQLPGQFPGLKRLTVDSSYFARYAAVPLCVSFL